MDDFRNLSQTYRLLYKELYKRDFYSFAKDFWCEADPAPFVDGKLVQFYCEFAQYLARPWIGYDGPEKEVILPQPSDDIDIIDVRQQKQNGNINIPPRHSKSMILNVLYGVWLWLNRPLLVASISHTEGLATKMNMKRQAVLNSERFRFFFPEIVLEKNTAFSLISTQHGELYSINRNALTGYGFDIGVCDDLTNAETARKDKEEMNNAWSFYQNTLPSRINDPSKYVILNIQQRLSPNDITGRIQDNAELSKSYIFVCLPAQFKKTTYIVCPISGDVYKFDKDDFLWPERFGDYSSLRAMVGETVWQTQYLQNPVSSDKTIIKEEMIREEDCTAVPGWDTKTNSLDLSQIDILYGAHDFPVKDKVSSDFLGSTLCYKIKKTLYFVNCLEVKQNFSKSKQYLLDLENIYPSIINIIEDKANGSPLLTELQDEIPGMVAWNPGSMSKEERMNYASMYVESGNVVFVKTKWDPVAQKYILNEGLQNLKQRLLAFPLVQHDDICDAFSMPILYVFQGIKHSVYMRAFNDLNIKYENELEYKYTSTFFNRNGDEWKALEIGISYGVINTLSIIKETKFRADIYTGLKLLKQFTPDKNVFIDASKDNTMSGYYDKENNIIVEYYSPENYQSSVTELNKLFGTNQILINQNCKLTLADIELVKFDEKDHNKIKTTNDGFVACIRTAVRYYSI